MLRILEKLTVTIIEVHSMLLTHEKRFKLHHSPQDIIVPAAHIAQRGDQFKPQMGSNTRSHNTVKSQVQGTGTNFPQFQYNFNNCEQFLRKRKS